MRECPGRTLLVSLDLHHSRHKGRYTHKTEVQVWVADNLDAKQRHCMLLVTTRVTTQEDSYVHIQTVQRPYWPNTTHSVCTTGQLRRATSLGGDVPKPYCIQYLQGEHG